MTDMTMWRAGWMLAAGLAIAGCADEGEVRERIDALEVDGGGDADGTAGSDGDTAGDSGGGDAIGDTSVGDTVGDTGTGETTNDVADTSDATVGDTTPSDIVDPPWEVDPDAPWALGRPIPVAGTDGWQPVIATIELSRMMIVIGVFEATASTSPVSPEWRKVESPMVQMTGWAPACAAPWAMAIDAPMSTQEWTARKGGSTPSV